MISFDSQNSKLFKHQAMHALQVMDWYQKEVKKVSTQNHDINVQYQYEENQIMNNCGITLERGRN